MMMRRILPAAIAMLTLAGTAGAQMKEVPRGERPKPTPEMIAAFQDLRGDMKSFGEQTVLPQLRTWKSTLDGAMSATDLATLNALRARATVLRGRYIDVARAMAAAWRGEGNVDMKQGMASFRELGAEYRAVMEELRPLAETYRPTLEQIGETARPILKSWKEEGKQIFQAWRQEHADVLPEGGMHRPHGRPGMMGMPMLHHLDRRKAAAMFMLWDGGNIIQEMDRAVDTIGGGADGMGMGLIPGLE